MCNGIVFCVMAVTRLQRNMNREREDEEITGKLAANLFSNLMKWHQQLQIITLNLNYFNSIPDIYIEFTSWSLIGCILYVVFLLFLCKHQIHINTLLERNECSLWLVPFALLTHDVNNATSCPIYAFGCIPLPFCLSYTWNTFLNMTWICFNFNFSSNLKLEANIFI